MLPNFLAELHFILTGIRHLLVILLSQCEFEDMSQPSDMWWGVSFFLDIGPVTSHHFGVQYRRVFFWHSFPSDHVKHRFALVVHTQEMQRFVCNCKHIPKAAHVLGVMTHTAVWRKVILRHAGVKLGSRVRRNRFQKGNRTPWSQCENNPYLSKLFQSGTETFRRTLRIQTLHKNS